MLKLRCNKNSSNILNNMNIEELNQGFYGKTSIQKEELLGMLVGNEIVFFACLNDIKEKRIVLDVIVHKYIEMSDVRSYDFQPKYDKEKFGKELLSYQSGDDVKIKAKLVGGTIGNGGHPKFELELISISKTGSTLESRRNKSYKEYMKGSSCFIATACYGNHDAPEVLILREFRDDVLKKTYFGKLFVSLYYTVSPFFAAQIAKSDWLKKVVKGYFIEPIVNRVGRNK
jgi:hypothetical protein